MSQKEILETIEKNPGILQCEIVKLHGYNGSLIKKMALRGDLIRELAKTPGHQNMTYKLYPASTGAMQIQQRL